MKITIEEGHFLYACDFSKQDKVVDGCMEEYHPNEAEMIDAFCFMLSAYYSEDRIMQAIKDFSF